MFSTLDGIGEKTINKIAQMALSSQLDSAESLRVQVKTDPSNLAKGILESLSINGKGLVTSKNLRLEEMNIILNTIAVSPFKALMGNIQLTQPSRGKASIVLSETDIQNAFKTDIFTQKLNNYKINLDGELINLQIEKINCKILETGKVIINAETRQEETEEIKEINFSFKPRVCKNGKGVVIEEIESDPDAQLYPNLTNTLLAKAEKIFNLTEVQLQGISLKIENLDWRKGQLIIEAIAGLDRFPSFSKP